MKGNRKQTSKSVQIPQDELMQRIRERLQGLSNAHRRVARYLLNNADRAAFLTAAELAKNIGISESTAVRFASAIGYTGYPELQGVLQEILRSRVTTVERLDGPAVDSDRRRDIIERSLHTDIENIRLTLRDLDRKAFREAVSLILDARQILVVGFRSAACLALFLAFNLNWILGNVKVAGFTAQDLWENLVHMGPKDLVIGMTFSRYTKATVQAVAEARRQNCKIIALTDGALSPLNAYADVILTTHTRVFAYSDSFVAPLSVVNALLAAASTAEKPRTMRGLRKLESLWERNDVYYKL